MLQFSKNLTNRCNKYNLNKQQSIWSARNKSLMSKIHEIPIVVIAKPGIESTSDGPTNSIVLALLSEIEAKLDALVSQGEDSSIDLRWLIGMPNDIGRLREVLGEGEVSATINNIGITLIQETAVPCVWWVSHRDFDGGRLGEFVEITEVPGLLRSDRLSIQRGLAELRIRSAQIDKPNAFSSM
jgi:hydrogenase-1 operon protein HyaF